MGRADHRPPARRLAEGHQVITLNVTAIFVVTQEVGGRCTVPRKQGKGINIASIQGLTGTYPEGMPTLASTGSAARRAR
jgi:NAD(P)-dependent dehydrogenase (short-subunit alcohol dehydrogenase family)